MFQYKFINHVWANDFTNFESVEGLILDLPHPQFVLTVICNHCLLPNH